MTLGTQPKEDGGVQRIQSLASENLMFRLLDEHNTLKSPLWQLLYA